MKRMVIDANFKSYNHITIAKAHVTQRKVICDCRVEKKEQLFNTCCSNIYAGHLWSKHSASYDRKIKTKYNNVFRAFMNLNRDRSTCISKYYVDHH